MESQSIISEQHRNAVFAAAAIVLVGAPALLLLSPFGALGVALGGPVSFALIYLAFGQYRSYEASRPAPIDVTWNDLSTPERVAAVELAWSGPVHVPPPRELPVPHKTFGVAAFIGTAVTILFCRAALNAETTANTLFFAYVASVLWGGLAFHKVESHAKRANEYVAATLKLREEHQAVVLRHAHRELAAKWICAQASTWMSAAEQHCIRRTAERMNASEYEPFVLASPREGWLDAADLPPARYALTCFLVGKFLAIREGVTFDLKQTSLEFAGGNEQLVVSEDSPSEREVYLTEIVGIEYERQPIELKLRDGSSARTEDGGHLAVSLRSGNDKLRYATFEAGAASALNAVRTAVRTAKVN